MSSFGMARFERFKGIGAKCLIAVKPLGGAALRFLALDMRRLVGEVQKEPQFDAWTRHRETDPVIRGHGSDLVKQGVLIDVEHAPDLVVCPTSAASFVAFALALRECCPFYKLARRTAKRVDVDVYLRAMKAVPIQEVVLFSAQALDEHQDVLADSLRSYGPPWTA